MSEPNISPLEIPWHDALCDQPRRFFHELRSRRLRVQVTSARGNSGAPIAGDGTNAKGGA